MKLLVPIVAALALCSAAGAASLSYSDPRIDSSARPEVAAPDLGFSDEIVEQSRLDEYETPLVTTAIDSNFSLTDEELASRDPEFNWVPASEPPPVSTLAVGCTFLGIAAIIRRSRTEKRRARRRTLVRVRAIIAAR